MKKLIGILGLLLILSISLVSATEVFVNVNSNEEVNGYFNLNSPDNDVWINGVNYQGYVDNKVIEATKGGMTRSGVADTLEISLATFFGVRKYPDNYDTRIANVFFSLTNYILDYTYNKWILPIQIRQNAIIKTMDQEVFCKNLAEEYFKVYSDENFKCENNKTYYKNTNFAIQVNNVP